MRPSGAALLVTWAIACTPWLASCDSSSKGETRPAAAKPPDAARAEPSLAELGALPGIELAGLDPSQVKALAQLLEQKPSPCGKSTSLRAALKGDPSCRRALFAGRYLTWLFKSGALPSEAEEAYDKRFVSPDLGKCDTKDAPMRGPASAPVTICEFSDFQCPHCKLMEPVLQRLFDEQPGTVKLYAKSYPISKLHPEATDAAAAAVAAGRQGKFWQMHDRLFANQDRLSPADLERYAAELKLDLKKWKADLPAAREAVERDHAEGERLGITGTPTFYINERKYAGPLRYEQIKDWVDEELTR
jgi:protein-disulfide isomerase